MTCRPAFLAAVAASLLSCGAAVAAELPAGRWYKVDGYACRAFRDFVDDKPSVIGTQRNVSQRACAALCNGTPNCAAYNYLVRIERPGGRPLAAQECQLLSRADRAVSTISLKPGESAYVCYKSLPEHFERPDFEAGRQHSFQDSMRPSLPNTPPAPPPPPPRID